MAVKNLNVSNFNEFINAKDKVILIDFWAEWCGPCKMMSPIVDQVAEEMPDILVGKVNVDEASELAMEYKVINIPTLLVFKNGQQVDKSVGAISAGNVKELIAKHV